MNEFNKFIESAKAIVKATDESSLWSSRAEAQVLARVQGLASSNQPYDEIPNSWIGLFGVATVLCFMGLVFFHPVTSLHGVVGNFFPGAIDPYFHMMLRKF